MNTYFFLNKFDSVVYFAERALRINNQDTTSALALIDGLLRLNRVEEAGRQLSSFNQRFGEQSIALILWFQYFCRIKNYKDALIRHQKGLSAGFPKQDFQTLDEWPLFRKSNAYSHWIKSQKKP
jgi:Tfp pilus assembly protein PilF